MNKIDKIVLSFTKTVNSLRSEAERLDTRALASQTKATTLILSADNDKDEANRAVRIASNLEGIING